MCILFIICVVLLPVIFCQSYPQNTIYERLTQEDKFRGFSGLIRSNRDAKIDLLSKKLTVFVPTNEAFKNYKSPLHSDLAFYHMALDTRDLEELKTVQNISCVKSSFPKLWITRTTEGLYVNNAEIVTHQSNYHARTKNEYDSQLQTLHVIDEVLDPIIRAPRFPHTAYDFMSSTEKWHLESSKTVTSFFYKVQENKLSHLYQLSRGHTYFIPVDYGIDPYKFHMVNKHVIFGHIVPYVVLFTRPTVRGFNYETMANDDYIYIVLSLEENGNKLFVKSSTVLGNASNPKGVFEAEIIQANIPLHNGVVHLISQPLGIFNRVLKPFPYLSISETLATDPTLDKFYDIGEKTGFNNIFTTHNVTFTYFVPNDYAWRQIRKKGQKFSGSDVDLLKRHLIISDMPYSMERLLAMTHSRNYTDIELRTVGGLLRLSVLYLDNVFYIKWSNMYIQVLKPNYECTDGFLHILAAPIAKLN